MEFLSPSFSCGQLDSINSSCILEHSAFIVPDYGLNLDRMSLLYYSICIPRSAVV